MANVNKHGLTRHIPEKVQREVRQRCGFGCIVCGLAIYQYEHLEPDFSEAIEHNADKIVLLCGGCHDKVTRGLLSKETIKSHALSPKCREIGFSFGAFDVGTEPPELVLGSLKAKRVRVLLEIDGDEILSILPPDAKGQPFRISAFLCDRNGTPILSIEGNEWRSASTSWDVTVVGRRIKIANALRDIALIIRSDPPNCLVVEKMHMIHRGSAIECTDGNAVEITTAQGQSLRAISCSFEDFDTAIRVEGDNIAFGCGARV